MSHSLLVPWPSPIMCPLVCFLRARYQGSNGKTQVSVVSILLSFLIITLSWVLDCLSRGMADVSSLSVWPGGVNGPLFVLTVQDPHLSWLCRIWRPNNVICLLKDDVVSVKITPGNTQLPEISLLKDIGKKRLWEHIKSYHVLALKQGLLPSEEVLGWKDPHNTEELTLPRE